MSIQEREAYCRHCGGVTRQWRRPMTTPPHDRWLDRPGGWLYFNLILPWMCARCRNACSPFRRSWPPGTAARGGRA